MATREDLIPVQPSAGRWVSWILHPRLMAIVLFVAAWEITASFFPPFVFPSLTVVGNTLWDITVSGQIVRHVGTTMERLLLGFLAAFAVGLALGILTGISRFWERFANDYVMIGLTVPGLIWAVLVAFWFGLSPIGPIFATMVVVFPFVAINVHQGVRAVDRDLVAMARVYRVSRRRLIFKVILPSLLPFLFAAARYAFAIGWKIVTLTEVYGATSGLGYMIRRSHDTFSTSGVIAWSAVFTALLLITEYGIFRRLEARLFRWRPQVKAR